MDFSRHTAAVILALLLLVGVPVFKTGYIQGKLSETDAVSSATEIIEQPSGEYVVLINRDRHADSGNLKAWESFFSGGDIGVVFEDISCVAADSDAPGFEMAKSFQSRLPENQMTIRLEDPILMRSKADHGLYDVMILSKEMYEATGGDRTVNTGRDCIIKSGSKKPGNGTGTEGAA